MPRLLFFAALREAAGTSSFDVDAANVGEALKRAADRFGPSFERVLSICTILHGDDKVAPDRAWDHPLHPGDEVALLPPVSGGEDFRMIDVGDREESRRESTAVCRLTITREKRDLLLIGSVAKGDAVSAAKIAGTLAAKRTPELIPLCHPLHTSYVDVAITPDGEDAIEVRATVRGRDRTGFEMEALTACAVAALTLYDFAKAEDPRMRIENLRIVAKSGGRSGTVTYE